MKALVIGGGGAIGSAVCRRLAASGARVGVGYCSHRERAEALAGEIDGQSVRIDVRDRASLESGFEQFSAGEPPDALVYAAGVFRNGLLLGVSEPDFSEALDVNLTGAWRALALCGRPMMLARRGAMVFLGSVTSERPSRGQNSYAASKAGLECLVRLAAVELAPYGVRVNLIGSGAVREGLLRDLPLEASGLPESIPMGRFARAEEIAAVAAFLLSGEASYVTGSCVVVDGGYSLGSPGKAAAVRTKGAS